jgi:hypothetical protein
MIFKMFPTKKGKIILYLSLNINVSPNVNFSFYSRRRQGEKRIEEWESFQQGHCILREDYPEASGLNLTGVLVFVWHYCILK